MEITREELIFIKSLLASFSIFEIGNIDPNSDKFKRGFDEIEKLFRPFDPDFSIIFLKRPITGSRDRLAAAIQRTNDIASIIGGAFNEFGLKKLRFQFAHEIVRIGAQKLGISEQLFYQAAQAYKDA